jgi:hypothetical protein
MNLEALLPRLCHAFEHAADQRDIDLVVAGAPVRLRIAGASLQSALMPSLQGLVGGTGGAPRLVIHAWSGGEPCPEIRAGFAEHAGKISMINEPPFHLQYNPEGSILSCIDTARSGAAYYHVPDPTALPDYEVCTPMRMLFNWHCDAVGALMVHAAAVGVDGVGVLIVGRSGAGKSTTSLQCLASGMDYLGDDYVAVSRDAPPVAHHLYRGCKVMDDAFERLPDLRGRVLMRNPERNKSVVILDETAGKLVSSLRIVAIVRPHIAHAEVSNFTRLSPLQAVTEFAVSTILQMPGVGGFMLRELTALCTRVPTFEMTLGRDPVEIAGALRGLIGGLSS